MNSSNTENKNLSATNQTENTPHGTAHTQYEDGQTPYFRSYREEQERRLSPSKPSTKSRLVTRLAGLLWALTDAPASSESDSDSRAATDDETAGGDYTERTASKTDFGTRAEPVDGLYGYTANGDPIVPQRGQLMRARTNANGRPADALIEPDSAGDLATWHPGNASSTFVDPTGEQLVGVASGLDESIGRVTPRTPSTADEDTVDRLRAYDKPEDYESTDEPEGTEPASGLGTADLEVTMPDGECVRLGDLVEEPEQFARTSVEAIERSLALEAEKRKVTEGICRPGELSDDIELVGHAKWLNNRYDELAAMRPSVDALAEAREQRAERDRAERVRPLTELDADEHEAVCAMAHRLLSDDFEKVYKVRKSPLTLATALAKRVNNGIEPTSALIRQAEYEANDPLNVQKIGNVRYMSTAQTKGRFSTQGRIAVLFENTHPGIKQAGVLQDDTGSIRFAIWAKSEWDETRPTPDPTDFGGRTLIRSHRFPELQVGDVVRVDNVVKGWYGEEATFETRRDSTIEVLERACDESESESRSSTTSNPCGTQRTRRRRKSRSMTAGKPVPKNPIAYWRGSESWTFPVADWIPDWWLAQENVELVERNRRIESTTSSRTVTT